MLEKDDEYDDEVQEDADAMAEYHDQIRLPSRCLFYTSCVGVVAAIGFATVFFAMAIFAKMTGGMQWEIEDYLYTTVFFVMLVPYQLVILYGSRKLLRTEGPRWGYTASIFAFLPVLTTGPLGVISIPYAIFAILTMIALANPQVRKVLRAKRDR